MAINQNHLFEDLDGVKCAIVEKNASEARVSFLRPLLELNGYIVLVVPSPQPKAMAASPGATTALAVAVVPPEPPPAPSTFTIGVTDVMFNPVNAIFGKLLKTSSGHTVTLAFWRQNETESHDDIPYFEHQT